MLDEQYKGEAIYFDDVIEGKGVTCVVQVDHKVAFIPVQMNFLSV
jgi:hypothetical protein